MRVLARTKIVEPSLPLSQRILATSRHWPLPTFLFFGIQRKLKRPFVRTRRWAIGTRFWGLRTATRMVLEQNSMTGQPRPRTVWMSARLTVLGEAVMDWLVWAVAETVSASPARTTAVRAARGRILRWSHHLGQPAN